MIREIIQHIERSDLESRLSENKVVASHDSYSIQGVLTSIRRFGKLTFGKVVCTDGQIQVMFRFNELAEKYYGLAEINRGTHIFVHGHPALTQTKEPTLLASAFGVLQASQSSLPDKRHGVSTEESRRLRYQDCLTDHSVHQTFIRRSKFINGIRSFLSMSQFLEVETPILQPVSSGALARPFQTNCRALEKEMYLRIAPETYLKRMTAAGYHKVFEIGKQFRNEGIDAAHMPEFTSCEWYEAYTNYEFQMERFTNLLSYLKGYGDFDLGFDINKIPRVSYRELIKKETADFPVELVDLDLFFKKEIRHNLQDPIIVYDYPASLAPLAKRKDNDPDTAEMWQFIWKGWEVVKCYSELVDYNLQKTLLEEQAASRENGNVEAMMIDERFLQTMEFGMPWQSGVGIGIDRLFALYMGIEDLRDTVFFPPGY